MGQEPVRRIDFKEFKFICRAITTYGDLNVLIKHIVEHICLAFDVKGCSILLFDDRENQ